jgi:hypothetical protein
VDWTQPVLRQRIKQLPRRPKKSEGEQFRSATVGKTQEDAG